MKFSTIINSVIITLAAAFLISLALCVRVGASADSVAVLKTSGMTCGSCANRITTALKTLSGVAVSEVDLEGGWVLVGYDPKIVNPAALVAKVNATGFSSNLHQVLTAEQFKQVSGRYLGQKSGPGSGCCGGKGGGCGAEKQG